METTRALLRAPRVAYAKLMKTLLNSSKFCLSNFLICLICQISSDFSTVKVLRYTVEHDFKIFVNNKIFIGQPASLPDHRKWPTAQTTGSIASILSQNKGYFRLHEPFMFQK